MNGEAASHLGRPRHMPIIGIPALRALILVTAMAGIPSLSACRDDEAPPPPPRVVVKLKIVPNFLMPDPEVIVLPDILTRVEYSPADAAGPWLIINQAFDSKIFDFEPRNPISWRDSLASPPKRVFRAEFRCEEFFILAIVVWEAAPPISVITSQLNVLAEALDETCDPDLIVDVPTAP